MAPFFGLVTVLYNSDAVLPDFFKSLGIQTWRNWRLYLVDNTPSEQTDELIRQLQNEYRLPWVEHLKQEANIGVAAGNNIGIELALAHGCSHVLLLNNDILIEQSFLLSRLVESVNRPHFDLIVPKIYFFDSKLLWMAGGYLDKFRALGVHKGYAKSDGPQYNTPGPIDYAPTCFMLISSTVFRQIGLMDERYFAYYDDVDFVYRASQSGYTLQYVPELVIFHKVSSLSGGDNSPFYIYYSNRNKIYFIRKNLRGIFKYISLGYALLSRMVFYLRFDRTQRKRLVEGIRDGFSLYSSRKS